MHIFNLAQLSFLVFVISLISSVFYILKKSPELLKEVDKVAASTDKFWYSRASMGFVYYLLTAPKEKLPPKATSLLILRNLTRASLLVTVTLFFVSFFL